MKKLIRQAMAQFNHSHATHPVPASARTDARLDAQRAAVDAAALTNLRHG